MKVKKVFYGIILQNQATMTFLRIETIDVIHLQKFNSSNIETEVSLTFLHVSTVSAMLIIL